MKFLSGLSMVAATVLSGRFLKWNTSGCNAPSGPWSEPSQSPSSSFDTAGLPGISSTFASPVRLKSTGTGPCVDIGPCGADIVPFILPSGPRVRSNVAIWSSTATNFTDLPFTATFITTRPVACSGGRPILAIHSDFAFFARSSDTAYSGEAEQHSGLKPNSIPGRPEHPSERSDAGLLIVREVFGLVKRTEGP